MSALAMAIYFQGLNDREMRAWTDAMLRSGRVLDLASLGSGRVDKHSTGGVGDKISLPLAPAAAACGVIVPMVAGRGLGHTGGTIDKLEAIPGYRADLDVTEFVAQLRRCGCAIIGQTDDIAPADRRLYRLRDVTATVEIIPLVTASIMSKKLAEGIEGLVLDVKVGKGAFMKTMADARELARMMVSVGEGMGVRVIAFITRMVAPLGRMVGNANEVWESLDVLDGGGPADVRTLVETLGGAMVELADSVPFEEGRSRISAVLDDGSARRKFEEMVSLQGGDLSALPRSTGEIPIPALAGGFVQAIDAMEIGLSAVALGAGRSRADDTIDPLMGIRVDALEGTEVQAGDPLATVLYGEERPDAPALVERIANAFQLGASAPIQEPLIIERLG
jgi:pyrimidine-nucleoside phosphorylase